MSSFITAAATLRLACDHDHVPCMQCKLMQPLYLSLQVLTGKPDGLELPENVNWVSRAMLVYRHGMSNNRQPSLKVLDRLLSCLRLPFIPPLKGDMPGSELPSPFMVRAESSFLIACFATMSISIGIHVSSSFRIQLHIFTLFDNMLTIMSIIIRRVYDLSSSRIQLHIIWKHKLHPR